MKKQPKKAQAIIPAPAQLAGGLDQAQPLDKLPLYMEQIVGHVTNPKTTLQGDLDMLNQLHGIGKLSALGTAAVLWHMRDQWPKLSGKKFDNQEGRNQDFYEFIFHSIGYMTDTSRRYCLVMDFLNEAKVNLGAKSAAWEALLQRDIKDLIGLGQYTTEHGLLTKKQLIEASQEPDSSSLRKKLNEYKGGGAAKRGLELVLQPNGDLEAWVGDHGSFITHIDRDALDEQGRRGLASLVGRAKIQER